MDVYRSISQEDLLVRLQASLWGRFKAMCAGQLGCSPTQRLTGLQRPFPDHLWKGQRLQGEVPCRPIPHSVCFSSTSPVTCWTHTITLFFTVSSTSFFLLHVSWHTCDFFKLVFWFFRLYFYPICYYLSSLSTSSSFSQDTVQIRPKGKKANERQLTVLLNHTLAFPLHRLSFSFFLFYFILFLFL